MISEYVKMNLNHAYEENKDGSVVVFFLIEHAIVRTMIVALRVEKK